MNDKLPKYFCETCIINLNIAYDFKNLCEQTQFLLCSIIETKSKNESEMIAIDSSINGSEFDINIDPKPSNESEMIDIDLSIIKSEFDIDIEPKPETHHNDTNNENCKDYNYLRSIIKIEEYKIDETNLIEPTKLQQIDENHSTTLSIENKQNLNTSLATFLCYYCGKQFDNKINIQSHIQHVHQTESNLQ